jgi:hypothetical protein
LFDYVSRFVVPERIAWFLRNVTWDIFGTVPPGLSWSASGTAFKLEGTLTKSGIYTFRIMASDPANVYKPWVYRVYTVSVMEIDEPAVLPPGTQDQAYSHSISTAYGWDPKRFHVKAGSSLPSGLELTTTGTIQGTPTGFGTFSFWIVVTDAEGAVCEKKFTLTIYPNFFNAIVWNPISTDVAPGNGFASASGALAVIGAVTPAGFGSAGGTGTAAMTLTAINNTGAPRNCRLRITVARNNGVPPSTTGGITTAFADTYFFRRVAGAIVATWPGGSVLNGVYEWDFIVPSGNSDWTGNFKTGSAVSAYFDPVTHTWVYPGGDVTWTIQFLIIS